MAPATNPAIQCASLTKRYGLGTLALDALSIMLILALAARWLAHGDLLAR